MFDFIPSSLEEDLLESADNEEELTTNDVKEGFQVVCKKIRELS